MGNEKNKKTFHRQTRRVYVEGEEPNYAYVVTASALNLRSKPDQTDPNNIIEILFAKDVVTTHYPEGEFHNGIKWLKVKSRAGSEYGYIMADYVESYTV